jgi:hypothetical protein
MRKTTQACNASMNINDGYAGVNAPHVTDTWRALTWLSVFHAGGLDVAEGWIGCLESHRGNFYAGNFSIAAFTRSGVIGS